MSSGATEPESAEVLLCATCGYDLRAQPRDGICPECATPIEKSIAVAAIPLRPAWRDSDPRWRRRMVAGAWVMVFIPLLAVLQWLRLDQVIRIPMTAYVGDLVLQDSFVTHFYTELVFCTGVVLFFAKERGRRPHWLDRTKRWGVLFSYLVLLLSFANFAVLIGLVSIGISALFMTLPIGNQPGITPALTSFGSVLTYYGPYGTEESYVALSAISALVVLLACAPMYQALGRSGAKVMTWMLVVPLAFTALVHLGHCVLWFLEFALARANEPPAFFFQPGYLMSGLAELSSGVNGRYRLLLDVVQELLKWVPFLGIALWLTIAQMRAWRTGPTAEPASA